MPPAVVTTAASCSATTRDQRAPLMAAERGGAGHLHQIRNAGAVTFFDEPIEFDEWPAEMLRQHPPQRRFAGAAQADQRDATAAVGMFGARYTRFDVFDERGQIGLRHLPQQIEHVAECRRAHAAFRQQSRGIRSSARAMARSTLTDGLPAPLSICAR